MTPDQLTSLAKQAGFYAFADRIYVFAGMDDVTEYMNRFADLVRNEVLEEAAVVCERLPLKSAKACAEVIRLEKS